MAFFQEKTTPWTSSAVPAEETLGEMDGTVTDAEDMDKLGKKQQLNVCFDEI